MALFVRLLSEENVVILRLKWEFVLLTAKVVAYVRVFFER